LNATYLGQGRSQGVVEVTFSEKPQLCYKVGTKWEGDRVLNALVEKLLRVIFRAILGHMLSPKVGQ